MNMPKELKVIVLFGLVVSPLLFGSLGRESFCFAKNIEDTIAYKLAILQTKDIDPEGALLKKAIEPERATVTEFHWILETLRNRCINPETAIADTIVQTWGFVKQKGMRVTLLDVARELSQAASNRVLFGDKKVNFRMTTAYWINEKFPSEQNAQSLRKPR